MEETKSQLLQLPLSALIPTRENPRKFVADHAFNELVKSIEQDGIIVPLIARPIPGGKYDLRAGFRRYKAAQKLKLETVPVLVRELTDLEALSVTIKENLDRSNLTPLEEAAAVASYTERGLTHQQVAAEFGRTPGWVARRAQLLKLGEDWRKALADSEHWLSRWPIASLELVAALNEEQQQKLWKLLNDDHSYQIRDIREGKYAIVASCIADKFTYELMNARWDPADATLNPKAGACNACSNRSSANPLLWEGMENLKAVAAGDRCLNPTCWQAKAKAYELRHLNALKEKHPELVVIETGWKGNKPAQAAVKRTNVPKYSQYQVTECKASDTGAKPAVKLSDDGLTSTIVYVKPKTNNGTHDQPATQTEPTVAQLRVELAQRRKQWAIDVWYQQVFNAALDLPPNAKLPPDAILICLADAFSDQDLLEPEMRERWQRSNVGEARWRLFTRALCGIATGNTLDLIETCESAILQHLPDLQPFSTLLEQAAIEIPEPAGWAEREAAEKQPPAKSPSCCSADEPCEGDCANCEHNPEAPSKKARRPRPKTAPPRGRKTKTPNSKRKGSKNSRSNAKKA